MATLALPPVLSEVYVVLLVTCEAGRVQFHLVRGTFVAAGAEELHVCSSQRESGLFAVVEFPDSPAVGRMALRAFLAQRSFVYILLLVAVDTVVPDVPVFLCDVALLAWHGDMLPK